MNESHDIIFNFEIPEVPNTLSNIKQEAFLIKIFGTVFDYDNANAINQKVLAVLQETTKPVYVVMDLRDMNLNRMSTTDFLRMFGQSGIYRDIAKNKNNRGFIVIMAEHQEAMHRVVDFGEKLVISPFGINLYKAATLEEADTMISSLLAKQGQG